MVHLTRLHELTEFIQEKMSTASDETKTALQAVLAEISKMNTDTFYLIRLNKNVSLQGYSGWVNVKNEHYFDWSDTNCTLFELLEEAVEWETKMKALGWEAKLITVNKNNVQIGDEFYDYCNGFFGRDYTCKKVIEVGSNYLVVELSDGTHVRGDFEEGWQLKYMHVLTALWKGDLR